MISKPSNVEKPPVVKDRYQEVSDTVSLLKACAKQKDLQRGIRIHAGILRNRLLERNCFVASTLVHMYAKCGALSKAAQILDELLVRDAVSWSALISAYAHYGQDEEALKCLYQMQLEGLSPDVVTFVSALKACASTGAAEKGQEIHNEVIKRGLLGKDVVLGTALVDMYAKCGALEKAKHMLDELAFRNIVTWNALIAGYVQQGWNEDALDCFEHMQDDGHFPDVVTFICILKACGNLKAVDTGRKIHGDIVRCSLLEKDIFLGTALVDMYAKCGIVSEAVEVLDELPVRNATSWTALIAGYAEEGQEEEALRCLKLMHQEGLSPDTTTFICILKSCGGMEPSDAGEQMHEGIRKQGMLGKDIVVGTLLVDMYAKYGALTKASQILRELPVRNVVTWNSLIAGYTQWGQSEEAFDCFELMQQEGVPPNRVTFLSILKACGRVGVISKGEQIHKKIVRQGLITEDMFGNALGNTLVDMYVKCHALKKASLVLNELPVRDVVCWSALISGYAQEDQGEEALKCLEEMQREGIAPNAVTFTGILKACGSIGAAAKGELIHKEIKKRGLLKNNIALGTTLVDMYAKCGVLSKAALVLDVLPVRNIISWNALIAGYAQQGLHNEALYSFERMQCEGLSPNAVTLGSVLNACSHSGLQEEGAEYFANMWTKYGFVPNVEHHTCMIDLFGHMGDFDKAVSLMKEMQFSDIPVCLAVLYTCQGSGNVKLGRLMFDKAVQIDKNDAAAYVLMAKIYVAAGMIEDARNIEAMREQCAKLLR